MNNMVEKIGRILESVEDEKRPLKFAALIERDDNLGRFDLTIAADWIKNDKEFLDYLIPKLTNILSDEDITQLSRVVVLNPKGAFIKDFSQYMHYGLHSEIRDMSIGGINLRYAHIFPVALERNVV